MYDHRMSRHETHVAESTWIYFAKGGESNNFTTALKRTTPEYTSTHAKQTRFFQNRCGSASSRIADTIDHQWNGWRGHVAMQARKQGYNVHAADTTIVRPSTVVEPKRQQCSQTLAMSEWHASTS